MTTKYNSTIQIHCKCSEDCKSLPTMSCFGYNYAHLPEDLKEKAGTRKQVQVKNRNKRTALTRKLHIEQKKVDYAAKLSLWFKYHMFTCPKVCENCNASLEHYDENDWFDSQHHIVEKSLCPSVASHPQNHLVLGKWCCHSQWHTSWLNASKMPVFERAIEKFLLFKDDIAENELRKVSLFLLDNVPRETLPPINQIMAGQSPDNQNSKYNESDNADNLAVNWVNVFGKQI